MGLRPLILVSNDDGIDAPGILALARSMTSLGEVMVVAPDREQSARSHALTMHEPLRVQARDLGTGVAWAVSGTPADSVYIAVHHLCSRTPDLIVSGINRGPNLGDDTWYSGTVAAAREGAFTGAPAIAVSLGYRREVTDADRNWWSAASLAAELAVRVMRNPPKRRLVLNLNVPDRPLEELNPLVFTGLGSRHYEPLVQVNNDPRGRRYYWIGGESSGFENQPETDGWWFHRGSPTLSALGTDMGEMPPPADVACWVGA